MEAAVAAELPTAHISHLQQARCFHRRPMVLSIGRDMMPITNMDLYSSPGPICACESLDALPRSLGSVGAQTSSVGDAGTMRNTFLQSEADSVSNSEAEARHCRKLTSPSAIID
ncbi:hypothetical protein CesoFtcFv8_011452 [Champsocephalus esox]|uniref:Uncharacterized protein n=1 Tax=Champsocephalus esox TaxID=159716 RepID=A0AAN8C2H0_9TELE|nr:hypothetical protein CesoFtcFv8_011452 [Champsocephalus esox]